MDGRYLMIWTVRPEGRFWMDINAGTYDTKQSNVLSLDVVFDVHSVVLWYLRGDDFVRWFNLE